MSSLGSSRASGVIGEEFALHYLARYGYQLVERNFRCPYGEIDIIVAQEAVICFIEVKAWNRFTYAEISHSITARKQKRIIDSASYFLSQNRQFTPYQPQFGVLFINFRTVVCRYIKHAFEEG